MAFLDNSGDIILDAVLTDTGRYRLAKGNGAFRVAKFALADDEINYQLFNSSHPSGSAYYDLEIMQTPILEAFTNNTSLMKHKLIDISRTNLLYLPTMQLNDQKANTKAIKLTVTAGDITSASNVGSTESGTGIFIIPSNTDTRTQLANAASPASPFANLKGILSDDSWIRVDQGMKTEDISFTELIDSELKENQYIIQVDNRLLKLTNHTANSDVIESYVDDDFMAFYYLTTTDTGFIMDLRTESGRVLPAGDSLAPDQVITGPAGTYLKFNLKPTPEATTRDSLFTELGSTITTNTGSVNYYYIDTNVRVTGATSGSSLDIPVRIMRHYTP